jgi:uncharacterized cupredoxin-like copper-binding protein
MKIAPIPAAGAAVLAIVVAGYGTLHHKTSASAASPAADAHRVNVTLSEFRVRASAHRAAAGKITFRVTNAGKIEHEMVVLRTSKPAGALGHASRIKEVVHMGEVSGLKPGATKTLVLSLKRGHYSLVCNLPGHYMAGMHTDFVVG